MHLHILVTGCRGRRCQLSAPNAPDEVQISECPSCVRGCAAGLFCACSACKRFSSCRTESRAFSLTCSLPFCRASGFRSFSCLITASYDLLGLISFLTDGKKECRAWTIRKGTKAPQAAGKIHSDFERGFIRASVIGYGDLEANNFDYAAVKAKGLQRTEGKEYVVKDGDVIEFLFNV